jgi:hypothetical protein
MQCLIDIAGDNPASALRLAAMVVASLLAL